MFERKNDYEIRVEGFVESDFTGNVDTRKSLTGYVFTVCCGDVSWKSTLQSVVVLSTTEAKYMKITKAIKEALWMKGLITELGFPQGQMTFPFDSQCAIHLAKHQVFHERSKLIDVKMHFSEIL